MIEFLKWLAVTIAGLLVVAGITLIVSFVATIVSDLAESRPWVIPVAFLAMAVILIAAIMTLTGEKAW
jgi:hypothetical protein